MFHNKTSAKPQHQGRDQPRSPANRGNPPTDQDLSVIVCDKITVSPDVNITEAGRSRIRQLSVAAHPMTVGNQQVVGNETGGAMMDLLHELKGEVSRHNSLLSDIQSRNDDLEARNNDLIARNDNIVAHNNDLIARNDNIVARNNDLEARVARLETDNRGMLAIRNHFFSARERTFLTFLRDFSREHGAHRQRQNRLARTSAASEVRSRITQLNKTILHGGMAEVDALMFRERRRESEIRQFEQLYGVSPAMVLVIASRRCTATLNVLNAVGGFHLEGLLLGNTESTLLNNVVSLLAERKFNEAEEASSQFPFEEDYVEADED